MLAIYSDENKEAVLAVHKHLEIIVLIMLTTSQFKKPFFGGDPMRSDDSQEAILNVILCRG